VNLCVCVCVCAVRHLSGRKLEIIAYKIYVYEHGERVCPRILNKWSFSRRALAPIKSEKPFWETIPQALRSEKVISVCYQFWELLIKPNPIQCDSRTEI